MNHVPDAVEETIDRFGAALLTGEPPPVRERLRSDLRLSITPHEAQTARLCYETEHTQTPPTLRDRGPFVTTIVDGVDSRLAAWGITTPPAYEYTGTTEETHTYAGTLRVP